MVRSARIPVERTRILIDIIILVKIRILVGFTRNIISTRIPVVSIRIVINLTRKFRFVHFQSKMFFSIRYLYQSGGDTLFYVLIIKTASALMQWLLNHCK